MKIFTAIFMFVALLAVGTIQAKDQMKLGGELGIGVPTGEFGDVAGVGFGLTGHFHYYIQPNLIVGGTLGYYSFAGKEIDLAGWGKVDYPNSSIIPIMGLINYKFGTSGMIPFVGGELGLVTWGMEGESTTEFGVNLLGGIEQAINQNLGWRATAKYNIVMTEGDNLTFFTVSGGIYFNL